MALAAAVAIGLAACGARDERTGRAVGAAAPGERPRSSATPPTAVAAAPAPPASVATPGASPHGDVERGRALAVRFECHRCHDGTEHAAAARDLHCARCHDDIATGRFGAGSPKLARWRRSVEPYRFVPDLASAGARLDPRWVTAFLMRPVDVRPHLPATMPRLALSQAEAADLAAWLTRDAPPVRETPLAGDPQRGRKLMEAKGCGGCHVFSGTAPLPTSPDLERATGSRRQAIRLAPDLRHTRDRFRHDLLVDWLVSPGKLAPGTLMPSHGFTRVEAGDVAAHLLRAELAPPTATPAGARMPLLARAVSFREVDEQVLSVTCRHCHGDPDGAGGDGGPGNTGGFGFAARSLDLSSYRGVAAGHVGADGTRHSLFERGPDGVPLLVAALLARRSEEEGRLVDGIRGMPLGLPALPLESIQLVDSWIAQGRAR